MNSALTFLSNNWQRFGLERYGAPGQMTSVVITPRFHASSHVVFLVLRKKQAQPVLVVKAPRLAGAGETLIREAANLRAVQSSRDGGFDSVPRVIAFERRWDRPILVETAIVGRLLDPPTVRSDTVHACETIGDWLAEVQLASRSSAARVDSGWFERLIAQPLSYLEKSVALSADEEALLARTRRLAETLKGLDIPLVVEHGDLSHPNLMLREGNSPSATGAGVVDWELADAQGLPACDLFFFLTYVTFALHQARENRRHLEAFHEAFFGVEPWIDPYVRKYAQRIDLPFQALAPLFVLTWVRYLVGLLVRLHGAAPRVQIPDAETTAWLRNNRYYALWRHAMDHLDEFSSHWQQATRMSE